MWLISFAFLTTVSQMCYTFLRGLQLKLYLMVQLIYNMEPLNPEVWVSITVDCAAFVYFDLYKIMDGTLKNYLQITSGNEIHVSEPHVYSLVRD